MSFRSTLASLVILLALSVPTWAQEAASPTQAPQDAPVNANYRAQPDWMPKPMSTTPIGCRCRGCDLEADARPRRPRDPPQGGFLFSLHSTLRNQGHTHAMMPGWLLLLVALAYVGLLFTVAWLGERHPGLAQGPRLRPAVYALALAVYCSSWTFYGAVGTAARTGLGFLPIYLGPILLLLFGWRLLERLVLASGKHRIVSISDFLSSRYGRARGLAAVVAVVAVVAAIPYFALQFKAVGMSVGVLSGRPLAAQWFADPALYVALMLAVFAILFGTRRIDATEHHRGMVLAIALESLVKLVAFVAIGVFALWHLPGDGGIATRVMDSAQAFAAPQLPAGFLAQTLLGFLAIICLPRQFHVAVVECQDPADLRPARWMFIGYLALVSVHGVADRAGRPGDARRGRDVGRQPRADAPARARPRMAGTGGVHRRPVGGDRHGDRGQRGVVDDGQQRPGGAAAAASRPAAARRRHRAAGAADPSHRDPAACAWSRSPTTGMRSASNCSRNTACSPSPRWRNSRRH